ncbi:Protein kinase PINOID 2 [Turnera subulata]|uniref:non-specific serine/threonine protein kinase n=1 Tax=Turnera subulata TaxID=218843 RepID=A0A9Q0G214_9ROSI|nr:Protein kinase PINOID 2 [Turnera subulata]
MATLTTNRDESDYDSSSSSITIPDSSRSWMSNLSFGSRRSSISIASSSAESSLYTTHKPHKANQAAWEAIRRLQASSSGRVGLDHFRLLRRLGSGDIGNVYLCQIRNPMVGLPQCFYAMKVVDKEALAIRNKLQRAEMEKEILGMLDHPFLPTLYAEFEASHYSCLVMEYCPGGDLYAARQKQPGKRFSISSAKFYAAETLLALEYLHMMGIVYRDLKPENVLVREDGHIMLSDFDLCLKCDVVPKLLRSRRHKFEAINKSRESFTPFCATPLHPVLSCFSSNKGKKGRVTTITEHVDADHHHHHHHGQELEAELVAEPINAKSKSFVGTHEYLAPEVISGQGHGSEVDWWTLGVFLYEMLYGRTPFKGENNEKTLVNILKQPLTFPRVGVRSSKEFEEMVKVQDLISKLLVKNPKKRIGSLKGSVEIKRHEFFKGVNWALIRSVRPPEVPRDLCKIRSSRAHITMLSKKEREAPYQIPHHHFDYF